MKTTILMLLFASNIMLMCTNDKPQNKATKNTDNKTKVVTKKVKNESILKAKQSADYSSLFTKDNNICLTLEEIAKATGLPASSISKIKGYDDTYCEYLINLPNGKKMNYGFGIMTPSKGGVIKEINNYKKNKRRGEVMYGMEIELSDTGDTYFTHLPLHGRLSILNTNYDLIVGTKYSKVGFNLEEKKEVQKLAVKIANYLLHKHKK